MFKIEVKDLPPWMGDSINELVVLGVDRDNHAVIVPLSFVQGAADKADEMAEKASQAASAADTAREGCDTAKDGIEAVFGAFPSFSEGEAYAEDAVVTYEGRLYRFTEAKEPGEWEAEKVEAVSVVMLTDEATMKALRAAGEAEAKAEYAKQEGDTAKEKAELADGAAGNADEKAELAQQKAELADEKAGLADRAAEKASQAASAADTAREGCDTAKDGIEAVFGAFPSFSEGEAYAEDAVVTYEGRLYRFTEAKEPGEWEAEKVEAVSVVMLTDEATMKALRAAGEAEAKAEYAKQEGDTAKEKAELADEKAGLADRAAENASTNAGLAEAATQRANDAADAANLSREDILAAIASLVPTGMSVRWPERITMGNVEEQRIEVTMEPEGSPQNVVFLSDNEAVAVAPDGRLTVRKVGISTIHVVPTTNAALYKTILVCVSEPVNALYGSSYRMLADGSYRLV